MSPTTDVDAASASTDPSARLLAAAVANLKITPTKSTNLRPSSNFPGFTANTANTEPPHSPTHWFMRPTHPHRHHPLAPPSGTNLPPDYDDTATMLLMYVDAMLAVEKRKQAASGETEFWTGERLARQARMEGKWKGEMGWGS